MSAPPLACCLQAPVPKCRAQMCSRPVSQRRWCERYDCIPALAPSAPPAQPAAGHGLSLAQRPDQWRRASSTLAGPARDAQRAETKVGPCLRLEPGARSRVRYVVLFVAPHVPERLGASRHPRFAGDLDESDAHEAARARRTCKGHISIPSAVFTRWAAASMTARTRSAWTQPLRWHGEGSWL